MNNEIGYIGGGNLFELGSASFVESFFHAIENYVFSEKIYFQLDWSLITDRLFKRTIAHEQLDTLIGTMDRLLLLMQETPIATVDWSKLGLDNAPNGFENTINCTLADVYDKFRQGLIRCTFGVKMGNLIDPNCLYAPLRIGNLHHYIFEERRPIEMYEALSANDLPFWLRDDINYPEITRIVMDGSKT